MAIIILKIPAWQVQAMYAACSVGQVIPLINVPAGTTILEFEDHPVNGIKVVLDDGAPPVVDASQCTISVGSVDDPIPKDAIHLTLNLGASPSQPPTSDSK